MLNLDLSKALPPKPYLYFSAFLPGLFFVLSVLLANPDLSRQLALRAHEAVGLGPYFSVFVGLFLAFVIGNALMMLASLIQSAVGRLYRIELYLWHLCQKHILLPFLTKITHWWKPAPSPTAENPHPVPTPRFKPPIWVNQLYIWMLKKVDGVAGSEEKAEFAWWNAFVRQLLLKRYGLAEDKLPATSFDPLYDVLSLPTIEEIRGSILVNASQATGWAGLLASWFAPTLRNRWYLVFAIFLIACGLFHDFVVARYLYNPDWGTILRVQAILREFPKCVQSKAPSTAAKTHPMRQFDGRTIS